MSIVAESLAAIPVAGSEVRRTCWRLNEHTVVICHKRHPILKPSFANQQQWQAFLDGSHGSAVLEVDDLDWRWSSANPVSFNCHTLSIGSYLGLGPEDWLEGTTSQFTLNANPARLLLDHFFENVSQWDGSRSFDELTLVDQQTITLENERTGDIIHSGTVRWIEGMPMIVSKLGEHPIIISKLQVLLNEYAGQFTHIRHYQLREN